MKKILVYGIVISCIVLISSSVYNVNTYKASQRGYRYGIPSYAEGVDSESEVIIFDRDEWKDHIGSQSGPDDVFDADISNDAEVVGAKSKSELIDWDREKEIPFFADLVLTAAVELEGKPEVENFYDVFDYITTAINDLTDLGAESPAVAAMCVAPWLFSDPLPGGSELFTWDENHPNEFVRNVVKHLDWTYENCTDYSFDADYVRGTYPKNIDGYILHRNYWTWTKEPFKGHPSTEREDVPFLKNPDDWYGTYEILARLKADLMAEVDYMFNVLLALNKSFADLRVSAPNRWLNYNYTLTMVLVYIGEKPAEMFSLENIAPYDYSVPAMVVDAILNPTGENPVQEGKEGLGAVPILLGNEIPGKFGFLYQLLLKGLPTLTPPDKFLKDVLEDFDIDGKTVETGIKGLDPATQIIGDVELDGNTVIMKFEYADKNDPREDWTVEFTYGRMGVQDLVVFKGSEIFYMTEGLPSSLEQRIIPVILGIILTIFFVGIAAIVLYIRHRIKKKKLKKIKKKYEPKITQQLK